jgi:hypothetical protein
MNEKIKILFLSASPRDLSTLKPDVEFRRIFEKIGSSETFEMYSVSAIRKSDLIPMLLKNKPDIAHFTGHGSEDGIYLENDSRTGDLLDQNDLAEIFERLSRKPRLLFLSSCLTATNIKRLAGVIDFVVASEARIEERAATIFAATFYSHLAYGEMVKNSFDLVHSQLKHEHLENEIAKYKLFIRGGAKDDGFAVLSPGKDTGKNAAGKIFNIHAKHSNVADVIYQTIYK